jgi:hypothetical protein
MKRIVFMVSVALVMALILGGGAASAQEPVSVQVDPTAQAIGGGQTLLVRVEVACEPGLQVLEANVSATQGATSSMAGIGGVVCDGNPHVYKVRVNALDGQFSRGTASVSAFVLVCLDPACLQTAQGQNTRTVSVVGAR